MKKLFEKLFELFGTIIGGILTLIPVIAFMYFIIKFAHFD